MTTSNRQPTRDPCRAPAALRGTVGVVGAIAALAAPAWACPSCGLTGDFNTLIYILAFMAIPYVVVSCVWFWIKRILAAE